MILSWWWVPIIAITLLGLLGGLIALAAAIAATRKRSNPWP